MADIDAAPGVLALIDGRTGYVYLVRDAAVDAGRRAGRYFAVCGVEVLAASLITPEGRHCRFCGLWTGR